MLKNWGNTCIFQLSLRWGRKWMQHKFGWLNWVVGCSITLYIICRMYLIGLEKIMDIPVFWIFISINVWEWFRKQVSCDCSHDRGHNHNLVQRRFVWYNDQTTCFLILVSKLPLVNSISGQIIEWKLLAFNCNQFDKWCVWCVTSVSCSICYTCWLQTLYP